TRNGKVAGSIPARGSKESEGGSIPPLRLARRSPREGGPFDSGLQGRLLSEGFPGLLPEGARRRLRSADRERPSDTSRINSSGPVAHRERAVARESGGRPPRSPVRTRNDGTTHWRGRLVAYGTCLESRRGSRPTRVRISHSPRSDLLLPRSVGGDPRICRSVPCRSDHRRTGSRRRGGLPVWRNVADALDSGSSAPHGASRFEAGDGYEAADQVAHGDVAEMERHRPAKPSHAASSPVVTAKHSACDRGTWTVRRHHEPSLRGRRSASRTWAENPWACSPRMCRA